MSKSEALEKQVGVRELRANLSTLLRDAQSGCFIRVVSRGEVVAQIGPPEEVKRKPREFGTLRGQIWVADDFDQWPEDILESFEAPL